MSDITEICCGECGIRFWVPEHWRAMRQENGKAFYCPNGHCRVYRESDADKLRRERDRLAQQIAQRDDEIRWQREAREAAERREAAARGQVTKLKKRASAAMCPCCSRTFTDLRRHIATKHPEMAGKPLAAVHGKINKRAENVVPIKAA